MVESSTFWKRRPVLVSRKAAARAESGGGGPSEWLTPHPTRIAAAREAASCDLRVMQGEYRRSLLVRATGVSRTGGPRWVALEVVLDAQLCAARVAQERRPRRRRVAGVAEEVVVIEIAVVEHVEHIQRNAQGRTRDVGEVFAEPNIDGPVRPGVRDDEAVLGRRKTSAHVRLARIESRRAARISMGTAP